MVTVKQVRAKRTEVIALQAALEAAQLAHQECVAELTHAADVLKVAKNAWIEGRDKLEELGREFALDEGENAVTPPISFEPPPVTPLGFTGTGKILTFPQSVLVGPDGNAIASGTISKNKHGVWVKEYTKADGTVAVEIVEPFPIEGNLSIGPAGTPVPACMCGGSGDMMTGQINTSLHAPQCPAYPGLLASEKYDANKVYSVKRSSELSDTAFGGTCACNVSQTTAKADGKPCTYHRQRGEFREPVSDKILFWPLQEVATAILDDDIPF